jgi:RNA polymerase sigma factor (sigma-70 family)
VNFLEGWSILVVMDEVSMSDSTLVMLARSGEIDALAALSERYRPSLYAAAIGLLRDRADAEDAVQETCVAALLAIGSLRDPAAVGGWLHAVLRNTCRMRLRRSGREVPSDQVGLGSLDATSTPEDVLDQHVLREWEEFYAELHEQPVPRTYKEAYTPDVIVVDTVGQWHGIEEWSAHEREAILLGVRAENRGLVASRNLTILEIDFINPDWANDHCPPQSTFVHRLVDGRSRRLVIHYV